MKAHTLEFKNNIKELGRQQNLQITYTISGITNTLTVEDVISVTPHYEANLLKSVMKQLDIETYLDIPKDTVINFRWGIKVGNTYEYLDYGNYIVYSSEKQEDTNTYSIVCYDKMLYSMKDYEPLQITYPTTLRTYLISLCQKLGYTLATSTFANMNKQLPRDVFATETEQGGLVNAGYTYRDILDDIAEATGSTIYFDINDNLILGQPNETNDTIDEEYLKDVNVKFGEKYGPINTLVLSRSGGADNIYYPATLSQNPIAIKISDNQIMNQNNRDTYMQEIFNNINGIEYFLNDFTSTGIMYYDLLDMYNVRIGNTFYKCLMLNNEQDITQGIEEQIYTDKPDTSETDYKKADSTDRKINQTTLIVDKQKQSIEALVTSNSELVEKTAQLRIDVDNITSEIGEIADVTITADGYGSITAENINESEPILLKIRPSVEDITPLRPHIGLQPRVGLRPHSRELIFKRINEAQSEEHYEILYNIPIDLYKLGDVYDEFVLDYTNYQCYVTHRIGLNANKEKYVLSVPTTEEIEYPTIQLLDGDYQIYMPAFENAYIYTRLMTKNLYTSQFATKVEMNSKIEQTVESIDLSVNRKLENYSTTQEMQSSLNLTADAITSAVSRTYSTKTETANAKAEAIDSANASTDSKLANYTTTVDLNTKIEQTAESINSSVSATYITKSASATNINNAKTEAINSANTSTDNKLKNYSTTTQMNSAITQKANEITSSVSSTYITKTASASNIATAKSEAINTANENTDNQINASENEIRESFSNQISQTSKNILQTVGETYSKKSDLENYERNVNTQFEQTSRDFNFQFQEVVNSISNLSNDTTSQFSNITKYIRFVDGNIVLGQTGNELTLKISNNRISFLQSDKEVAYFSNNKLYITDGEFLNSLKIGNFSFIPRSNGNLSFRKTG